jgi:predicted TIM-barrel fold metal-dependent hydrolase
VGKKIDVHCHFFAFSESGGGYVHPKFVRSLRARWYMHAIGVLERNDALWGRLPRLEELDERYANNLVHGIEASSLDHAVILALDGVYDVQGRFDRARTPKSVTNERVVNLCSWSPKLLFGASINPMRRDAKEELAYCIEHKPALMKSLSNVQGFDPASREHDWFYEELRIHKIPVLQHIGLELAVPNIDIRFANLDRLEAILRRGVVTIAAHCCGGRPFIDSERTFARMCALAEKYPNLYIDISAMASVHRKARFKRSLRDPLIRSRLVYGTDFPIPTHPWAFGREVAASGVTVPKNYFDRDVAIKAACGVDDEIFKRGYAAIAQRALA